jgi:hypothetical protein
MSYQKIILVDFDATVHGYQSGWQGAEIANDPPVPGAIEWVRSLIADDRFDPQIYSSRSRQDGGVLCMKEWFIRHGMPVEEADALKFPTEKPAAFLTIDDRAIQFDGTFPSLQSINNFVPWNVRARLPSWWDIAVDEADKHGVRIMEAPPMTHPELPDIEGPVECIVIATMDGVFKRRFCITQTAKERHRSLEDEIRRSVMLKARELERDVEHHKSKQ